MENKDYFNGKTEADKKIIHLYMLNTCTHHCALCCNKQYDTNDIPVVTVEELKNAEVVCLTGGEPFLVKEICNFADQIKAQYPNIKMIYVYTCGDSLKSWLEENYKEGLHGIDGVNISPKNRYDAECVNAIFDDYRFKNDIISLWSNRIYLFPNVRKLVDTEKLKGYESVQVINREWQEEFEPDSGIFRRLPILFN